MVLNNHSKQTVCSSRAPATNHLSNSNSIALAKHKAFIYILLLGKDVYLIQTKQLVYTISNYC